MGDSEFALCVQGGQEEPRIRVIKLSLPSIDVLLGAEEEAIGKLWFLGCCGGGCAMIRRGDSLMLNSSEGCNCLLIVLMFGMMLAFNNYFIFLLRFFVACLLCFIVFT